MRIVFVSNYFNHHQAPFAREMDQLTDHQFFFIETTPMEAERKNMGWGQTGKPAYVLQTYSNRDTLRRCRKLILEADAVIWGSCPFRLIKPRLRAKKLTFAYSEHLFKEGYRGFAYWGRAAKYFLKLRPYQANHYLLCSSAHTADNYHQIGLFRDATLKWGYFPEVKPCQPEALAARKKENEKTIILWVGRLIGWKHPEAPIAIAKKLKQAGYSFSLNLIGNGELEPSLRALIDREDVADCVHLLGAMSPEQVRLHMEQANLFLITSDHNEGWGAVLNESMNSGCAVVASNAIGSAPYLIQDGTNGSIFESGNFDSAYQKIADLMDNPPVQQQYGRNACRTISEQWNAQVAAQRFCQLITQPEPIPFSEGICSRA